MTGPVTTIWMPKFRSLNPTRKRRSIRNRREARRCGIRASKARELMHLCGLKKLPGNKGLDTELHLWKKASAGHKTRTGMSYTVYCCPLRHRCKCMKTIHVGRGGGILILKRCGLYDVHSHEDDGSKDFKYEQIV